MLVDFIERQFHPAADLDSRMGLLAWQSGEVLWDDLAVCSLSAQGWSAGEVAAGSGLDPHYVMRRLADLTLRGAGQGCYRVQVIRPPPKALALNTNWRPVAPVGISNVTKPRLVVPPVNSPSGNFGSFTQGESGDCPFDESQGLTEAGSTASRKSGSGTCRT